jgi:hypothetical protein
VVIPASIILFREKSRNILRMVPKSAEKARTRQVESTNLFSNAVKSSVDSTMYPDNALKMLKFMIKTDLQQGFLII